MIYCKAYRALPTHTKPGPLQTLTADYWQIKKIILASVLGKPFFADCIMPGVGLYTTTRHIYYYLPISIKML